MRPANVFKIERIISHEKYTRAETGGHDIALIKLRRPWNGPLMPISSTITADPASSSAFLMSAGFGSTIVKNGKPQFQEHLRHDKTRLTVGSRKLREVFLPSVSIQQCALRYPRPSKWVPSRYAQDLKKVDMTLAPEIAGGLWRIQTRKVACIKSE